MLSFNQEIIDKLRNMVIYIIKNTYKPDFIKLNYLLYMVDKQCYMDTAFTMSDMIYITSAHGPIPVSPCNKNYILTEYCKDMFLDYSKLILHYDIEFDNGEFSDSDLKILATVCSQYEYIRGQEIRDNIYKDVFYQIYNFDGENKIIYFDILEYLFSEKERLIRKQFREDAENIFDNYLNLYKD